MTDDGWFATTGWGPDGIATLEATGSDPHATLQAGLRGVLSLIVDPAPSPLAATVAIPVHGGGDDLGSLFVDLVEELCAQLNEFAATLYDVALDGVLRRNEEGYRAWGYATAGSPAMPFAGNLPELVAVDVAVDTNRSVTLHATLRRA